MNIEDIKVGETYNVRVTVEEKNDAVYIQCRTSESAHPVILAASEAEAFSPISSENGIKNAETAPKYDPCRLFRKGDIVEPVTVNGRLPKTLTAGYRYKVLTDEANNGDLLQVKLAPSLSKGSSSIYSEFFAGVAYLRLVTPVEEQEPYYIVDDDLDDDYSFFAIQNRNSILGKGYEEEVARYIYGTEYTADKPTVRKRAEAERDRLNAEWRKEIEK